MSNPAARMLAGICVLAAVGALVAFAAVLARRRRVPMGGWLVWATSTVIVAVTMTFRATGIEMRNGLAPG